MKVCITEKPSVAREIAQILGANSRNDGYFEGNGYQVTWTFGHLCCLKNPDDYTDAWKRWNLSTLPMIPPKFSIKLIADRGYQHQFNIIKALALKAECIINCGDAGQEGELIQRWVMQKAGVKCPVYRLWISSLTEESIRKGFAQLKPQADFDNLYMAGLSRAIGDWILGMNATRLYTLKYAHQENGRNSAILSIGRVQTPTLALITERQKQIDNFKPEIYFEAATRYRDVVFSSEQGKITSQDKALQFIESLKPFPLKVTNITRKTGREGPKRLFDLTSLQVEANKLWGWSADETLKLIQSLYEKKVTTYPRVDTTYLSTDIYPKIPVILGNMQPYAPITAPILASKIQKSKKIFDDSKVTDHHAIIPTGESPRALVGNERQLYHLIAMRFIAAFYPDCVFEQTTVNALIDKHKFKATGKVIKEPGWRVLFPDKKTGNQPTQGAQPDSLSEDKSPQNETEGENEPDDNKILPEFTIGESGAHTPFLNKKTTQPPKLFTEGTLLRAMETAGKTIDDEDLREAMKENGIGRPSTRSAIIETLFKRGYIKRQRKSIVPTQAGIDVINIIRDELLKSAKLTGLWENKLRRIERGAYAPGEFINELKQMITEIVLSVMADNSQQRIAPQQHNGVKGKTAKENSKKATSKNK